MLAHISPLCHNSDMQARTSTLFHNSKCWHTFLPSVITQICGHTSLPCFITQNTTVPMIVIQRGQNAKLFCLFWSTNVSSDKVPNFCTFYRMPAGVASTAVLILVTVSTQPSTWSVLLTAHVLEVKKSCVFMGVTGSMHVQNITYIVYR
jgi:hypothetical protein